MRQLSPESPYSNSRSLRSHVTVTFSAPPSVTAFDTASRATASACSKASSKVSNSNLPILENSRNPSLAPMDFGRISITIVSDTEDEIAPIALPTSESSLISTRVPNASPTQGMYDLTGAPMPMMGLDTLIEQEYSPLPPDMAFARRSAPAGPSLDEPHSSDISSNISSLHSFSLMTSLHLETKASADIPTPLERYDATCRDASLSYAL